MNPLIVDLEPAWRGGQNQALLLMKGLRARGHAAELVAPRNSALAERALALGAPVHMVPGAPSIWRTARILRKIFAQPAKPDVLHANEPHALTAAWVARAHTFMPVVVSRRVGYSLTRAWLAKARYRAAKGIIAISQWVAENVAACGIPRKKISVIYEGVEIPRVTSKEERRSARARWNIPGNAPLLGSVAVLSPDKGQEYLIRALAHLRAEFPACRLLLAGDGPCRPRLERIALELGVEDAVIFAGFVKEIETVYAALDVFLFPVLFEGLGTSLLAAMSYGVPSVAFNRCALGEIIENEKSGLLVETADLEEIRKAAARLLRDQGLARRLGQNGRKRVEENFSADRMVSETLRVYAEVLGQKSTA